MWKVEVIYTNQKCLWIFLIMLKRQIFHQEGFKSSHSWIGSWFQKQIAKQWKSLKTATGIGKTLEHKIQSSESHFWRYKMHTVCCIWMNRIQVLTKCEKLKWFTQTRNVYKYFTYYVTLNVENTNISPRKFKNFHFLNW